MVRRQLTHAGLDLWGVAATDTGRAIVVGNGGRTLWDGFVDRLHTHPERLRTQRHPFDTYVAEILEEAVAGLDVRWRLAADPSLPIQTLAVAAGLGHHSRLGLLIHPTYGPWMGLRAVCFTDDPLEDLTAEAVPLDGPGPCPSCEAPCATACPGAAIGRDRVDLVACARVHVSTSRCDATCHARDACPIGAEHRYPPLAVAYHSDPARGREALAAHIGLSDPCEGQSHDWSLLLRS